MLYSDFILKAKKETISQADNGLWYLEPNWRSILCDCRLLPLNINDDGFMPVDLYIVEDELKLEVVKRNTVSSSKPIIEDWLFEVITSKVDPAITQEENDYIQNVIEFMRTNHALKSGDTDGDNEINNIVPFPPKD